MDYIATTLGLKVAYMPWNFTGDMPYFITDRYEIQKVTLGPTQALVLKLKAEFPTVSTLQKHIARIQKSEHFPVLIELETVSKYRRDTLIKAGIPFVVPGKQLYLPFLGAVLNERCDPEVGSAEKLLPSAQAIFFYYLYSKQDNIYISNAVRDLQYSAMSVSRASRQLVQTGLFEERKKGVRKLLIARYNRKEMFRRMHPNCSRYKESGGARCSNHYISEGTVYAAITQEIEKMLADGFLSRHSTKIIADYEKRLANMDVDIHQLSVKQEELSNALLEVYEAYTRHCTTKDEFKNQSEHLSMEHTDCEIKVQALIAEKGRCKEQLGKFIRLISALREYQESRTLTRELIEVFVERISIFPQQRIELVLVVPELAASLR